MNNRNDNCQNTLDAAFREINQIFEKYDLCGAVTLISSEKGNHRFVFQPWSAMHFEIDKHGNSCIGANIKTKDEDYDTCQVLVNNCYAVSNYLQKALSFQSYTMQKVNDDLCTAFNINRDEIKTEWDCKNLH